MPNKIYTEKRKTDRTWLRNKTITYEGKKEKRVGAEWDLGHGSQNRQWELGVSSVHGILQARILEWVAIPFSRGSSQPRDRTWVSCIAGRCFTIWTTRKNSLSTPKKGAGEIASGIEMLKMIKKRTQQTFLWRTQYKCFQLYGPYQSLSPLLNSVAILDRSQTKCE